jgi:serine/threonine protein kinase
MNYLVSVFSPVLVNYYDYFFKENSLYIVTEYTNKDSLQNVISPLKDGLMRKFVFFCEIVYDYLVNFGFHNSVPFGNRFSSP